MTIFRKFGQDGTESRKYHWQRHEHRREARPRKTVTRATSISLFAVIEPKQTWQDLYPHRRTREQKRGMNETAATLPDAGCRPTGESRPRSRVIERAHAAARATSDDRKPGDGSAAQPRQGATPMEEGVDEACRPDKEAHADGTRPLLPRRPTRIGISRSSDDRIRTSRCSPICWNWRAFCGSGWRNKKAPRKALFCWMLWRRGCPPRLRPITSVTI